MTINQKHLDRAVHATHTPFHRLECPRIPVLHSFVFNSSISTPKASRYIIIAIMKTLIIESYFLMLFENLNNKKNNSIKIKSI